MSISITVPENYGYVVLTTLVGQFVVSTYMGGVVGKARNKFGVEYPNMYGTPGLHKEADAFNRVQRGHQNMLETLSTFSAMALVGGLQDPIICSVSSLLYLIGGILFQQGYADTKLEVKMARYKKGGGIKWIGYLGVLVSTIRVAGKMNQWW